MEPLVVAQNVGGAAELERRRWYGLRVPWWDGGRDGHDYIITRRVFQSPDNCCGGAVLERVVPCCPAAGNLGAGIVAVDLI